MKQFGFLLYPIMLVILVWMWTRVRGLKLEGSSREIRGGAPPSQRNFCTLPQGWRLASVPSLEQRTESLIEASSKAHDGEDDNQHL